MRWPRRVILAMRGLLTFQPALIKALRQQLSQTGDLATEIVEAGRENQSSASADSIRLFLRLIEARDMSEFHPLIAADLPLLLELEAIVILSSEDRLDNRASAILRPTIFRPGQAALIRQLFPTTRPVELQQDITGDPAIYGKEQACLVASQALVHLHHSDLSMVVAFCQPRSQKIPSRPGNRPYGISGPCAGCSDAKNMQADDYFLYPG